MNKINYEKIVNIYIFEININEVFELFNEAAGKDSNFQNNFGENDEEIENDLDKVNYWYHKSAENDNKFALYKLGLFYELGKGVWKNKERAFYFYKKSADLKFADVQYKLGYCYEKGFGTDFNKEKALDLYRMAAKENKKFFHVYMNRVKGLVKM